jgi:cytosine/adenosine deaminase-related metal-dependent hydrolase
MASSLIRGKYVICRAGNDAESSVIITDGAVFQRDGLIEEVGDYRTLKASHPTDEEIGGSNDIVFPGLVNSHHHGRGVTTFQMGTCDDSLERWLIAGWGRRPWDHYLMIVYTAMQMIESGTTTVMYNHSLTPIATIEEDQNTILRGFADTGMRTAFSISFREQSRVVYGDDQAFLSGLPADLADSLRGYLAAMALPIDDYFALFENLHRRFEDDPASKVSVLLSPANIHWVTDETLQRTKEAAGSHNTGIHIHLLESSYQKEYGFKTWGKTPVAHLQDLAFLGPELSCAHSVWLTDDDIQLLAQSETTVCHNASSNLRLKNGIAPVTEMAARGVNVAMGTDSTALNDDDDMVQEMRLVNHLHRMPGINEPAVNAHQVLRMATINAARPTFFQDSIGALEKGRRADMVVMDFASLEGPYLDSDINVVDALINRGKARDIKTVLIDGRVVLKDGEFPGLSKADVVNELKDRFSRPLEPATLERRSMVNRLAPYVERFYQSWNQSEAAPHYRYNSRT